MESGINLVFLISKFDLFIKILTPAATLLSAVIGVWLRHYFKKKREKEKEEAKDPVVDDIKRCNDINKYIDGVLNDIDADRITIYQFHNGDHYYTGHDIQKMSAVFESRSTGISREKTNNKNLLVSYYNKFLSELIEQGVFFRRDVQKINDISLRERLLSQGVKSFISYPIYSINGKLIAFMSIEYVKSMKSEMEDERSYLKDISQKLSGYLSEGMGYGN